MNNNKNSPIGIFDSGLGGLTAVNALKTLLPAENFVYVGDTARVPYGGKDVDTLRLYGKQIIAFLQDVHNVKLIIVACGTISSNVMADLRKMFAVPLIDVVLPGIAACLQFCKQHNKRKVGVIATEATIKSGFFQRKLAENNEIDKADIIQLQTAACPLFVPIIEAGLANTVISQQIAAAYLHKWSDFSQNQQNQQNSTNLIDLIDTLILGCTHYPLLSEQIQQILPNVHLIDMAQAALVETNNYLTIHKMHKNSVDKNITNKFYVSGDISKFNAQASKITGLTVAAERFLV
ncbi:MAG: glutamate racemase [Defluviitaleaceae bacterium]|nr:glutamate racemase [Defluviitaleaceae bacterium]